MSLSYSFSFQEGFTLKELFIFVMFYVCWQYEHQQRLSRRSAGAVPGARGRGRADARDLSMDSGIQGSSCDLDVAVDSSSASDHLEDEQLGGVLRSATSTSARVFPFLSLP